MLLLAPYGRSTAINITCLFDYFKFIEIKIVKFKSHTISVQKLQISLLVLITEFSPLPLHWGKNYTSWALSTEWLLWDVLKMYHFTQLGFTDNLELKEEDSNRNRLNTLLVCRTETINRQTIVWVIWVFFFFSITFGEQTLGKRYCEDRYNAGKSQS